MRTFTALCWFITLMAACYAAISGFYGFNSANGAPQQAAAAAGSLAIAIIPYIFTRAIEGMRKQDL